MNETDRLILENQQAIINKFLLDESNQKEIGSTFLKRQLVKTTEALAPQSDEIGCEEDIKDGGLRQ